MEKEAQQSSQKGPLTEQKVRRAGSTHTRGLIASPRVERDDASSATEMAVPLWNPGVIDQRLHELTNRRWLSPWRRIGEVDPHPPLITEVDATGVNRRKIARLVSPDQLRAVERQVIKERAALMTRHDHDHAVQVFSFQHLLIQALQEAVLRSPPGMETTQETPPINTIWWQEGALVSSCRETYTVSHVKPRVIRLESSENGSVDVYRTSNQMRQLRRLAPALRVTPQRTS